LSTFAESIFSVIAKALTSQPVAGRRFSLYATLLEHHRENLLPARFRRVTDPRFLGDDGKYWRSFGILEIFNLLGV
jgi:hypothetical protein